MSRDLNKGIKRFDNGNLHIKFSPEEIEYGRNGISQCFQILNDKFEKYDIIFFGEDYYVGNHEMCTAAYSLCDDVVYNINWNVFRDVLLQGKTLHLVGREAEAGDYSILYEEGYLDDADIKTYINIFESEGQENEANILRFKIEKETV